MGSVLNALASFWNLIVSVISGIRIQDILDIAIIAYIIYKCIGFFRETRAGQLIKGLVILLIVWLVAGWLDLVTLKWLLYKIFDSAIIVAIILFQPELRRALERMGRSKIGTFGKAGSQSEDTEHTITAICKAAGVMQEQKIGALIVYERSTQLGEIISTGTEINADVKSALLQNIFFPKSPLHDGAAIIRDGKIAAAGCILPLVQNDTLNTSSFGTRHRAAIGISEISDAVVIVVSEETGNISLVENGSIDRDFNSVTLHAELSKRLLPEEKPSGSSSVIAFIKKLFGKEDKNEKQ